MADLPPQLVEPLSVPQADIDALLAAGHSGRFSQHSRRFSDSVSRAARKVSMWKRTASGRWSVGRRGRSAITKNPLYDGMRRSSGDSDEEKPNMHEIEISDVDDNMCNESVCTLGSGEVRNDQVVLPFQCPCGENLIFFVSTKLEVWCSMCADTITGLLFGCVTCEFRVCLAHCYETFFKYPQWLNELRIRPQSHWGDWFGEISTTVDANSLDMIVFQTLWYAMLYSQDDFIVLLHLVRSTSLHKVDRSWLLSLLFSSFCGVATFMPKTIHKHMRDLYLNDQHLDPGFKESRCIWLASRNESVEWVAELVSNPRVNPAGNHNYAIGKAGELGNIAIIKLLLSHPNTDPGSDRQYALFFACQNGHEAAARLLLQDPRVNPSVDGRTSCLWAACFSGSARLVEVLLQDERVHPGENNSECLTVACGHGWLDVVRILLQDDRVDPNAEENRALASAAQDGYDDIVRLLLSDPRVDPRNGNQRAFILAIQEGKFGCFELFMQDGRVDPSHQNNRAIRLAALKSRTEMLQILLADDRSNPGDLNSSALRHACQADNVDCVKVLLADPRVDPNAQMGIMLATAATHGSLDCAKLLVQDGRCTIRRNGALSMSMIHDHFDVFKYLVQHTEIDLAQEYQGLSSVVRRGRVEMLAWIIDHYPHAFNEIASQRSVASMACDAGNPRRYETIQLLLKLKKSSVHEQQEQQAGRMSQLITGSFGQSHAEPLIDFAAQENFPIHLCAYSGDLESVNLLLSLRREETVFEKTATVIAAALPMLRTPTLAAAQRASFAAGSGPVSLSPEGRKVVDPSDCDNRALMSAASRGWPQVVSRLLAEEEVDPVCQNQLALQESIVIGCESVLDVLLSTGKFNVAATDFKAIRIAAMFAFALYNQGGPFFPNAMLDIGGDGFMPLERKVHNLIDADSNDTSSFTPTELMMACPLGHTGNVDELKTIVGRRVCSSKFGNILDSLLLHLDVFEPQACPPDRDLPSSFLSLVFRYDLPLVMRLLNCRLFDNMVCGALCLVSLSDVTIPPNLVQVLIEEWCMCVPYTAARKGIRQYLAESQGRASVSKLLLPARTLGMQNIG